VSDEEKQPWTSPPGSDLALEEGCTCPRMDNAYGRGRGGDGPRFGWFIAGGCPLHAKDTP
jgi:hypothetical protein